MLRILTFLLLFSCLPLLSAQVNFVKNGDFTAVDAQGMPINWKVTSQPFHNVKVADFIFSGTPIFKKCFTCQPGGSSAFSKPYPLVILEQDVILPAGIPVEFFADVCHYKSYTGTNADRGQFKVYLGSTLISTTPAARSNIVGINSMVDTINCRTKLTTGGKMTLKITCERYYYSTLVFCHIDNVFLGLAPAPSFAFAGERELGQSFKCRFVGDPNATVLALMSISQGPIPGGLVIPGISGGLRLDPSRFWQMWSGKLDANGLLEIPAGTFPNIPELKGIPLWYQGFQATTLPAFSFGSARPFAFF